MPGGRSIRAAEKGGSAQGTVGKCDRRTQHPLVSLVSLQERLFSRGGGGCTLNTVRKKSANRVVAALLLIQLVLGLQWQVALAGGADPQHCPAHPSNSSPIDGRRDGLTSTSAPSSHTTSPVPKHACCGLLDCQCHGAQSSGARELPLAGIVCSASVVQPVFATRPPVARTDELFRPPIASV